MTKRRRILILLASGVVAVLLYAVLPNPFEPFYKGRSLTHWLGMVSDWSNEEETLATAKEAIRHMGANAHPYLLAWVQYQTPPWKEKLLMAVAHHKWLGFFPMDWVLGASKAEHMADGAMEALTSLGEEARPAIPELVHIMNDPKSAPIAYRPATVLAKLGTKETLPPILGVLTNRHHPARFIAVFHIPAFGTNAGPAIPGLLQYLQDADEDNVAFVADILRRLKLEPGLVLSALATQLSSSNIKMRQRAAFSLGCFEAQARPVVPALLMALSDPSGSVRKEVTNALLKIAPEVLTNAPPK